MNHNLTREKYTAAFEKAYALLNESQRKAVDAIDGPVMAIAGPGTGKTQLLALRVCKILLETDMSPFNILCLTFTDAGATAMRNRLMQFLGPDAYNVSIHTYHSFCNSVIRENAREFSDLRELQNTSDLETLDIITKLIDQMPLDHPLARNKGEQYYDWKNFKSFFSSMKQENWTVEQIEASIEEYKELLLSDPEYQYKRATKGNPVGSPKMDTINGILKKYESLPHAAILLDKYNQLLAEVNRIDFNDSILWVIRKFKENQDLLYQYQERFQYILADEYQDTNGTQNELLFLLSNYDEKPNLFIVGDDDQAIYRFQGANMSNILDFKTKYNPIEIVLNQNYRSNQPILDSAMQLIDFNVERLSFKFPHLTKQLKQASASATGGKPELLAYSTVQAQEIGILHKINLLIASGVDYRDIAIIYRSHKEVVDIVKYMSFKNIPINLKNKVNILQLKEIRRIVTIMRYISEEYIKRDSMPDLLFEILHYDFFGLTASDIGILALYSSKKSDENEDDLTWRQLLSNKELLAKTKITQVDKIYHVNQILEQLILAIPNVTLQVLFERIITETGLLAQILGDSNKTWRNQVINAFFNVIKEETSKSEAIDLFSFLSMIDKMEKFDITIPLLQIDSSASGINLMTAHGSKGLEFDHVFILNATKESWLEKKGQKGFSIPPTLFRASSSNDEEDERRLFYVSMTRARKHVYITYPLIGKTDKSTTPLKFLTEIGFQPESALIQDVNEDVLNEYVEALLRFEQGKIQLIDKALIDRALESLHMSASAVSKYLNCPITYYFENILRIPMARTAYMGFGNAIHHSLEKYFNAINDDPKRTLPPSEYLMVHFQRGMQKFRSHFTREEFTRHQFAGEQILMKYYEQYHSHWLSAVDYKLEYKIKTEMDGIPISGIMDKIEVYHDHVEVTDYKTGRYDSKKLSPPKDDDHGGDYWRQVVFYKILLDRDVSHKWNMTKAYMDFVEIKDNKPQKKEFSIAAFEIDIVRAQTTEVYNNIKAYKFEEGCNDPKCRWCNFTKQNMTLESPLMNDEDEEMEYPLD